MRIDKDSLKELRGEIRPSSAEIWNYNKMKRGAVTTLTLKPYMSLPVMQYVGLHRAQELFGRGNKES